MPVATVKRLAADGPFRMEARYHVAAGGRDEHFDGVSAAVAPIDDQHVAVTIDLTRSEHARLLASMPER